VKIVDLKQLPKRDRAPHDPALAAYGHRIAECVGINLEEAKALPPLPRKPAAGEKRQSGAYTSGKSEADEPRATG
jgi:hypothetical protein